MANWVVLGRTTAAATGTGAGNTAQPTATSTPEKEGMSMGDIVGIAIGIPSALVALGTLLVWLRRRRIGGHV